MLLLLWQSWKFHVYISHYSSKLLVITDMLILICDLDIHICSVLNPHYIIIIIIIIIITIILLLLLFFTTIFSKIKWHVWLKCNLTFLKMIDKKNMSSYLQAQETASVFSAYFIWIDNFIKSTLI